MVTVLCPSVRLEEYLAVVIISDISDSMFAIIGMWAAIAATHVIEWDQGHQDKENLKRNNWMLRVKFDWNCYFAGLLHHPCRFQLVFDTFGQNFSTFETTLFC